MFEFLSIVFGVGFVLGLTGLGIGVLSGLFGVGGGFMIVPAVVLFSGIGIHRAVATSLLVIALVSISRVTSYLVAGRSLSLVATGLFVLGGVLGLLAGPRLAWRLSGAQLQRAFAVAILGVAAFTVAQNIV